MKEIDEFYLGLNEPLKSCLLILRDLILEFDPDISEGWKYKAPCFIYKQKPICYLWIDRKLIMPYILLVDGNKIDHPLLEQGDRKRMKVFYVDPKEDIMIESIYEILKEARRIINNKILLK